MAISCPGCHRSFASGAWGQHIARTANPACRAIYDEKRSYLPGTEEHLDPQPDDDDSPRVFDGDFFGNDYTEEDFPGWDGQENDDSSGSRSERSDDSESSDPYSSSDDDEGPNLEPPPAAQTPTPHSGPDPMDDEHGRPLNPDERRQAEEDIWIKPIVQEFPGRAGEAIEENIESGYQGYKRSLGGNPHDNPYAPFTSKIDWEMAHWAKMRGPGSTAVTELMGIEDVRPSPSA